MKTTDKNGNVKIGPKKLPEDLYDYLVYIEAFTRM